MNRFNALILACLLNISSIFAFSINIPAALQDKVALSIIDSSSLEPIYNYRESAAMLIASNMKLITSYVGINALGNNFSWPTTLAYSGKIKANNLTGNLVIIGGGNPDLTTQDLTSLIAQVKTLGVDTIHGNLIIDESIFNQLPSNSELYPEPFAAYAVNPAGLIINNNLSTITLNITQNKIQLLSDSNTLEKKLNNQLQLSTSNESCNNIYNYLSITQVKPTAKITITGNLPRSCKQHSFSANLLAHQTYNHMLLNKILRELKIKLTGHILFAKAPAKYTLIKTLPSSTLAKLIPIMNKQSDNLYAKTILLSLGAYRTSNQQTLQAAKQLYMQTLIKSGLYFPELNLENGAGLSRSEKLTSAHITQLLLNVYQSNQYNSFLASLATPNESGTLANEFTNYANQLYAKTGTLSDTKAYSGYFIGMNGNTYIFSMIANNLTTSIASTEFKNLVTNVLQQLNEE